MQKYPFVKQEGIKDCGAACMQMIIKYYHGFLNLESIRQITKTTKEGTNAYNLVCAANKIGFSAKGFKCEFDDINQNNIILPCISNMILDNSFLHFIVIYEINFKSKYLIIGDPSDKVKKISFDDFKLVFNKVLIMLTPTKVLPIETNINIYSFMFNIIKRHKPLLKQLLIISIFITLFSIINSFFIQYMIEAINNNSKSNIYLIFYIFFSIGIIKIISDYFRNKILIYLNQRLDLNLIVDNYFEIIKLPYHYFKNRTTGEVVSRFNDLASVRDVISKFFLAIFIDMPLAIIALIFMYLINHTLFFISLCMLIIYILIILVFKNKYHTLINDVQKAKSGVNSYMVESMQAFETVKGLHIEDKVSDNFEKKYVNLLRHIFNYQNFYFLIHLLKELINSLGFYLIILIGSIQVINQNISLGSMLTFNALLTFFLEPIRNVIDLDSSINEAKNALRRVLELIMIKKDNGIIDRSIKGDIEFRNLTYTYDNRNNILNNINLKIKSGTKTVIVGKSGSGKSTLFKLLMKYHDVEMGKILIDNIDINNYKQNSLKNILYLSQNEILFTDTVYNNINIDNSDNKLFLNVCKNCYVDEIINKSNLGYNMILEENGNNISGGERQRIILARTLLKPFNILIIDEGTNQIDINLERKILKNLIKLHKTIIFITHRLDNIDLFDNLIELEEGKIIKNEVKNGKY